MKTIVASGPVIIQNGKLLVNKDDKDEFYKLPGGIHLCHLYLLEVFRFG